MKISSKRGIFIFSILIISLTGGLAIAGQNCPSSLKLRSTRLVPVLELSGQQTSESDEADTNRFQRPKKHAAITAEQIAAANLKCYAALHRDLDEFVANESCETMPSNTAHVRGQKLFN
ncbi:MAG: hypothetical protein WCB36_04955 [Burkholderiales bacterium]